MCARALSVCACLFVCLRACVCTSGRVQYRNSSGSSWKSWILVTAFWSGTNSELAIATSLITISPGGLTSRRQIRSNAPLEEMEEHTSYSLAVGQWAAIWFCTHTQIHPHTHTHQWWAGGCWSFKEGELIFGLHHHINCQSYFHTHKHLTGVCVCVWK